jgi:ABC-2 type transport system ATP-binding protein
MAELQAGKRLLVALDAAPDQALDLLKSVHGVKAVETLQAQGAGHRYALDLSGQQELTDTAPQVANQITTQGWKLYALQPVSRDLETIFGEISAREGR